MTTELIVSPQGIVRRYLYDETLDLSTLGSLRIQRASYVEPGPSGETWVADLTVVDGPTLGPFTRRSLALEAEREWLVQNWLNPTD